MQTNTNCVEYAYKLLSARIVLSSHHEQKIDPNLNKPFFEFFYNGQNTVRLRFGQYRGTKCSRNLNIQDELNIPKDLNLPKDLDILEGLEIPEDLDYPKHLDNG